MAAQHTPYLLKVLSGTNAGALVRLKAGETVIGKSMASDIILHDEDIADSHVKLQVADDAIILKVLARPVYVDSNAIETSEYVLRPYQVVTVGGVDFFIADVRKPDLKGSAAEVANEKKESARSNTQQSAHSNDNVSLSKQEQKVDRRAGVVSNNTTSKSGSFGGKHWLWLGLLLLLVANVLFFMPYLINFAEKMGLRESAQQRAESMLESFQSDGLAVSKEGDGKVFVTGYVDTRNERRDLIHRVSQAGGGVNYKVWVREELVDNAERVANALGQPDLRFESIEEGRLKARGYVSSEEDWARIKTNIMGDVSGIQSIDDRDIQTLMKRKEALVQFIEKKGLSSRVRVTIENDRIKVDGELTQSELQQWDSLYQEFIDLNGLGPAIVENLFDARERLKLSIRSVSVGDTPFLVSKGGKKYMEGSHLGNDYFIKKITPEYVLLSNGGIEIPIHYGAEAEQ